MRVAGQQPQRRADGPLGLRETGKLVKTWDVNPTFGGPIKRDRLWFFATGRHIGTENTVAGIFANRNAGDITKWTYDPGQRAGGGRQHDEERPASA